MFRTLPVFRAAPSLVVALASVAGIFATNNAASASVVFNTQANVNWAAAPGSVIDYGVWVIPEGAATPTSPTQHVSATTTTISGQYGQGVHILVAAFYAGGVVGPFSAPSDPIFFRAPVPAPYDFNGDGRTDRILRDDRTGRLRIELVDGTTTLVAIDLLTDNPQQLRVSGSADFDGDGNADLVMWEHVTGAAELWLLAGEAVRAKLPIATLGTGWFARASGDIDSDGTARLLWHDRVTGESQLWSMRTAQVVAQIPLLNMPANWEFWGNCDVDGNGVRDVVWIDNAAKAARLWMFDASGAADEVELFHPGKEWWLQTCGDFDRDGGESLVWQRSKELQLWSFDQIDALTATAVGQSRRFPVPSRTWVEQSADFDGDGDADMAFIPRTRASILTRLLEADSVISETATPIGETGKWTISSW